MPDYYALMSRAVTKLDRNTATDRRALFDGARDILAKQLRSRRPPATEPEIRREQHALELAIRKVEFELATAVVRSTASATAGPRGPRGFVPHLVGGGRASAMSELSEGDSELEFFNPADPSTFLHLTAHAWLDHLMADARGPSASEALKKDAGTVLKWLNVKKPEDIGAEQRHQWACGFEQYLMEGQAPSDFLVQPFNFFRTQLQRADRTVDKTGARITEEMRAVYDRLIALDEGIADFRSPHDAAPTAPPQKAEPDVLRPDPPFNAPPADEGTAPSQARARFQAAPLIKGIVGFILGFALIAGLEALLSGGTQFLSVRRLYPFGVGWIVMPIAAGGVGWMVVRRADLTKAVGLRSLFAALRRWPREHQIALAMMFAIGWTLGIVVGFFVSVFGTPNYYPRTFGTWLLGSPEYFPLASLLAGLTGGLVGTAMIAVRQLLHAGDARSAGRRRDF
jgi:hypothetical protein